VKGGVIFLSEQLLVLGKQVYNTCIKAHASSRPLLW